jgi:NADH-quinone oxidoreductase subunit A
MTLRDYLPLIVFLALGLAIGGLMTVLTLIGPRKPNRTKSLPYESGILSTRPAKQRFSIDFYLTAMLFIVFDIELAFFYPLAVVLKDVGTAAVIELVIFVAILLVGYVYVWRKGALEWR